MAGNKLFVSGYKIIINKSEIPGDFLVNLIELTVQDDINLPSLFSIRFNIADFQKGDTRGIDLKNFMIGDSVKVLLGIDDHVEIITGEITSLDFSFEKAPVMEIRGYDKLHRLRFGTMRRSFKNMKDSDIASLIASEIDMTPEVESTQTSYPYIFQNNQSNYDFLLERAKRIGYEIMVNDNKFIFRKSKESESADITLEYGKDFQNFAIQIKTLTDGSNVELRGWDIKSKKEIASIVSKGNEKTKMKGKKSGFEITEKAFNSSTLAIVDNMIIDPEDAENMAKARYNVILKEFITGSGKCVGDPVIRAGKTLEIKGLGERINGTYYLISTIHSIKNGIYNTSFKVRRTGI
jgi:phage protein D